MAFETEDHGTQYCSPAMNSSCIKTQRSTLEYYIMYVFFSLLSVWTVLVNLLVIISISYFKKLHTPTNLLILSLAVSDMVIGLIVIPVEAIKLIESCWYFGEVFCELFIIILGVFISASLSNLILIALDRFMAVIYPLLYTQKISMTKSVVAIFLNWTFSTAFNTSLVVGSRNFGTDASHGSENRECNFIIRFGWRVADFFFTFLFPCVLIITLYLRIFYIAHRQVKVINSMISRQNGTGGSVKRKSDGKAAMTLGIIVVIHMLCCLHVYVLAFNVNTVIPETTANVMTWTMYVNSALNPLVYAFFYPWFRKALKHILTKICCPAFALMEIFA